MSRETGVWEESGQGESAAERNRALEKGLIDNEKEARMVFASPY
jgi:hypothetical protein